MLIRLRSHQLPFIYSHHLWLRKGVATVTPNTIVSPASESEALDNSANAITWKQVAKDIVPGRTIVHKGMFAGVLGALYVGAVKSGYYIPTDDTVSLASFVLLLRMVYLKFGRSISDYLDKEIDKEEREWYAMHQRDHDKYSQQLAHLQSFLDYPMVVSTFYDLQAANLVLEREVDRLTKRLEFRNVILSKAKELVQKEQERLQEEARQRRIALQQELMALLNDESVQERILQKAIKDLQTQPFVTLSPASASS